MDTIQLCKILKETTYVIDVFHKGERIKSGSGVAFDSRGFILTAAHLVARLDHVDEDVRDPETQVFARTWLSGQQQYRVAVCAPALHLGPKNIFSQPFIVDLAVLIPTTSDLRVSYLPIREKTLDVGEQVLMAGFPDEMELPLSFEDSLNRRELEIKRNDPRLEPIRQMLMIKSGMIGNTSLLAFVTNNYGPLHGQILFVDNAMHLGSSGGPVITGDGEIAGLITKRAITNAPFEKTPELRVPSGSTIALTPRIIFPLLERAGLRAVSSTEKDSA